MAGPVEWFQRNIVDPLAGVNRDAKPTKVERDWSLYQRNIGEDPTSKAVMQRGMDLTQGLSREYGDTPQIRMPGEGNPEQLAAGRRRRNAQYAAAGLPNVGFDPGLAGQEVDGPAQVAGVGGPKGLARAIGPGGYGAAAQVKPKEPTPPKDQTLMTKDNMGQSGTRTGQGPDIRAEKKPPTIEKERR